MATPVDICNAALSLLGNPGDIVSISPVEGGRFAERCAREYPICRNSVLESYDWSFASRRAALSLLYKDFHGWGFAYAKPADAVSVISIIEEGDRYFENPRDFIIETDPKTGSELILTDVEDAYCRYQFYCTNTNRYTEKFCQAVTYLLAARLAGDIIKGTTGMKVAESLVKQYTVALTEAKHYDMKQRRRVRDVRSTWDKRAGRRIEL